MRKTFKAMGQAIKDIQVSRNDTERKLRQINASEKRTENGMSDLRYWLSYFDRTSQSDTIQNFDNETSLRANYALDEGYITDSYKEDFDQLTEPKQIAERWRKRLRSLRTMEIRKHSIRY